jgi:Zn-dependent protease
MVVAAVISASGLSPTSRERFQRGGRGVPVPDLVRRPRRLPRWAPPALLAASVGVLLVLFPSLSLASVLAIHVALLVHEGGHALAMWLTRTQVRGVLFVPALGAATLAEHPFRTRWHDAIVAMSGPLTGVPLAIGTLWFCEGPPPEWVRWGLVVAVAYNLLNLLPFVPMDGGRVLVAIVAGLPRVVRLLFTWAPLAAAVGLLFLLGPEQTSIGAAAILAAGMLLTRLALRRLDFHQWVLDVPLSPASLRLALRDLTAGFGGPVREDVDGGVPATPMTGREVAATVLLYLALVLALAVSTKALAESRLVPEIVGGF